ncbi:hypothetical protein ACWDBW_34755 [Streptomyces sp. NPDC001107]
MRTTLRQSSTMGAAVKAVSSSVTAAIALLALAAPHASAASTRAAAPPATPGAYIAYLESSSQEGAKETLSEFKALSPEVQKKFIGYLNDPETVKEFLEQAGDLEVTPSVRSTRSVSTHGGDVVYTSTVEDTQAGLARTSRGTHEYKFGPSAKIFGITIMRLSLWVNYFYDGSKITKVNFADSAVKNISGFGDITGKAVAWMDGGFANGQIVWHGSFGYKDLSAELDKREKVWTNANGHSGAYLKNI